MFLISVARFPVSTRYINSVSNCWGSLHAHKKIFAHKDINYLTFKYFDLERTWWRSFQKGVVWTKFDIYVFNNRIGGLMVSELTSYDRSLVRVPVGSVVWWLASSLRMIDHWFEPRGRVKQRLQHWHLMLLR